MSKENKAIVVITIVAYIILVVMLLTSCKTIHVGGGTHKADSVRVEMRVDTFMQVVKDSVTIQLPCSDSIEVAYVDRWHTNTIYKTRDIHDTIAVCKVDSVPYAVEVEKVVTKNSGFAMFAIWHTIGTWIILLAALAIWLFKKFYLRR